MEEEVVQRSRQLGFHNQHDHGDSDSDESDTEEQNHKVGSRDSNALLDTWLAELDSLTTVSLNCF